MKFGKYLETHLNPEWREHYMDYEALKKLISEAAASASAPIPTEIASRTTSLTVTVNRGDELNEEFFNRINAEVAKVSEFIQRLVEEINSGVEQLKQIIDSNPNLPDKQVQELTQEATNLGQRFLKVEKYVNLNYLGFHKILKKHDKQLPRIPCYQFYLAHLHNQPWTQGGYSDVIVKLSDIHSRLRQDTSGTKDEGAAQGFVRSTQKFWVSSQDISTVKYHILQNLPVFRFDKDQFEGDSQLISSVYFDNSLLELYHGRLDKKPNAIAVRIRWYGPDEPATVFVERKTHKESWKGEVSVKERFTLNSEQVIPFLRCELTAEEASIDLREKSKSEEIIAKFIQLFTEVQEQVDSKQLAPFIRTIYMRTAFQIPYDSSVRISLDTNLRMMKENPVDGPSCMKQGRWFRDPTLSIFNHEITNFPHGVLEIKLSLREEQDVPQWVQELLDSGYLIEVHKFSKFIHGTATLFPDQVQAVPYWIDDDSIRHSIVASAEPHQIATATSNQAPSAFQGDELMHPLLEKDTRITLMRQASSVKLRKRVPQVGPSDNIIAKIFPFKGLLKLKEKATVMRLEPKVFFANERTFMSWLEMAVTLGSISTILLAVSSSDEESGVQMVEIISLILLPLGIVVAAYSLFVFWWRASKIVQKQVDFIHDEVGTVCLGVLMMICMFAIFVLALVDYLQDAL